MRNPTFLKANWRNIIMANYPIPAAAVQQYLPRGVELDLWEGQAYVSLVGFLFEDTKLFGVPIPFLGTFEEVNLRLYVVRHTGNEVRRGVVFINETVPYAPVAWMANKLYKEHYTAVKTKYSLHANDTALQVDYQWQAGGRWNTIGATAAADAAPMVPNSFEEFIFEHYYGYTRINASLTEEYTIAHPSWHIHQLNEARIDCDFAAVYGPDFAILNHVEPTDVFMAEGSAVAVKWKRHQLHAHDLTR